MLLRNAKEAQVLQPAGPTHRPAPGREVGSLAAPRTVIFIDPQPLTRDSVAMWLRSKLLDLEIGTAADVDEAANDARSSEASLVLYHLGTESIEAPEVLDRLQRLEQALPEVPVAILAAADDWDSIVSALRSGAKGYIPTSLRAAVIVEAIRLLCAGGSYAPVTSFLSSPAGMQHGRKMDPQALGLDFSSRQLQIISCLRRGFANKNIAYQLSMSEGTVKVHIRNIMKKLGAQNRTQIVIMTSSLVIDDEPRASAAEASEPPVERVAQVRPIRHAAAGKLAPSIA